jgi:hypothetical protein
MPGFQLVGEVAACFGDDFDAALDQPLLLLIEFKAFKCRVAQHASDALDRLDDIGQARDEGASCH